MRRCCVGCVGTLKAMLSVYSEKGGGYFIWA